MGFADGNGAFNLAIEYNDKAKNPRKFKFSLLSSLVDMFKWI
jgi:hypothetical protein